MLILEAMGFRHCTDSVTAAFTGHDTHDSTTGAEEEVVLALMLCICFTTPYSCAMMRSSLQHLPTSSALRHHNTK